MDINKKISHGSQLLGKKILTRTPKVLESEDCDHRESNPTLALGRR